MAEYSKEEIKRIEQKWQDKWEKEGLYSVKTDPSKPKYYVLDMFPYPSGAGLHVGHPLGYIASDIVSRYKRLKGYNVLHPMGFDAFGLPAEQYAIQTGQHPAITTAKNIETYKRQLRQIGFSYDWNREVQTCDPAYYKWTQWIFMQLFNAWYNLSIVDSKQSIVGKTEPIQTLIAVLEKEGNKNIKAVCNEDTPVITAEQWEAFNEKEKEDFLQHYRIAYQSETMVNWCAALGTVLSNDEVKDGVSERGGYPVERIKMLQWSMRISAYAERLLNGLDTIDWPEPVKEMQRNWIGKSRGCELEFSLTPNPSPGERGTGSTNRGYKTSEKKYWHILKEFSKGHRKNPTPEEAVLWGELRNNKLEHKIRRQHAIGAFIADFVCLDRRTVIEIDGGYHLNNKEYDDARTAFLNDEGFNVIRFTNEDVKNNLQTVLSQIKSALDNTPSIKYSSPSPQEAGGEALTIKVFTTRIDTIFGATFLVLAPEHELVEKITTDAQRSEVTAYIDVAKNRSERERMTEVKRVSGAFTGAYAINPFNNEKIPIWISDYVLAGYGTGAVMAVPGHDERDHRFAKHFNLPIVQVVEGPSVEEEAFVSWDAKIINSGFMNGMTVEEAIEAGIKFVEEKGIGKGKVNYRMRDAIFGRQRYWGEPFPVYYKDGIPKLIEEKDLPVTLPEIDEYKPTETGEPPLARAKDWGYRPHPQPLSGGEGGATDVKRATDFIFTTDASSWKTLKEYARENRKEPTEAEDTLWQAIRNSKLGHKFRRQHAIEKFIVDFVCIEKKLVIEVDGPIHEQQVREDEERTQIIQHLGFRVIRFRNEEVLQQLQEVLHKIKIGLASPSPVERGPGGEVCPFELTTMPGWAGSSWYWFRYMDSKNNNEFVSKEAEQYWKDVDLYMGGSEHATGHLLYSRFWCKALKDLGFVQAEEPFKKLINQGHIQGVSQYSKRFGFNYDGVSESKVNQVTNWVENGFKTLFAFDEPKVIYYSSELNPMEETVDIITPIQFVDNNKLDIEEYIKNDNSLENVVFACKYGYYINSKYYSYSETIQADDFFYTKPVVEKMSKSKLNVVNPDKIVDDYGADTLRLYEMFLGPLEMSKPWNTNGIDGVFKFLRKFWNLFHDGQGNWKVSEAEATREELKVLHKTLKKVEHDITNFSFNTTVSEFMICVNELSSLKCNKRAILEPLIIALSPYAPHIAEELWEKLGYTDTILRAQFPAWNEEYLKENSFEYPISINGKVRTKMEFALDMPKEDIEKIVLASDAISRWTEGKPPKKVIVVPGKIVNVVI